MFRKEIKPLSESMIEAIGNTINKLEYVEEKEYAKKGDKVKKTKEFGDDEIYTVHAVTDKGVTYKKNGKLFSMRNGHYNIVNEEIEVLDESKALLKDYQAMKAQGKKDSGIMDVLMSMPKYKKMSRDQMAKVIGDAKRKGIFKEEVEGLEEADANSIGQALMKKHGEGSKVVKKSGRYYIKYTKDNSEANVGPFNDLDDVMKHLKEEVELEEKMDPVGKADADIDNDGDVDSSDKYLHARRKAISKAMKKRKMNEQDTKMGTITVNSDEERKKRAAAYRAKKMKNEEVELDEANKKLPRKDVMQAAKIFAGAKKKGSLNSEAEDMVVDFAIKKLKYSKQDAEMLAQKAEVKYIDMVGEEVELDEAMNDDDWVVLKGREVVRTIKNPKNNKAPRNWQKSSDETEIVRISKAKKMGVMKEVELEEGARFKMGDIVADKKGNAYSQDFVVTKVIPNINKSKPASYKVATKDGTESPNIWPESRLKLVKAVKEELELDESDKSSLKKHIEKLKKMYKDAEKKNKARNNPYSSPEMSQIAQAIGEYEKRLKEEVELDEAKSATGYTIYHKTFSSAVQHAISQVEKQGYTVDEEEWDNKVAMGPKKPSAGKTNSYTIPLLKNGKPTPRKLQMQVYYDEGRYELNMYIS